MHFVKINILYTDRDFIEVCLSEFNWLKVSSDLGNGVVSDGKQAIIWESVMNWLAILLMHCSIFRPFVNIYGSTTLFLYLALIFFIFEIDTP